VKRILDVLNDFGGLLGILGLLAGLLLYRMSRRLKEPCWDIRTTNLVRGYSTRFPSVQVLFGGAPVENLSVSRIVLWNRGRDAIHRSDIAPGDQLRVVPEGEAKLLDVQLLQANSAANRPEVQFKSGDNAAYVAFDFLNHGHGVVFQVFHTGTRESDPRLTGTVIGAGPMKRRKVHSLTFLPFPGSRRLSWQTRRRFAVFGHRYGWLVLIGLSATLYYNVAAAPLPRPYSIAAGVILGVLSFYWCGVVLTSSEGEGNAILPEGLDTFEQGPG
jgi:hypothetical protein